MLPARHYVAVDDDLAALVAIKDTLRARVTTIHVSHGRGTRPAGSDDPHQPDRSIASLAEILDLELDRMRAYLS